VDGTGSAARFGGSANSTNGPNGIAADLVGNLYVTDVGNHSIRKITQTGVVTTLVGGAFGGADGIGAAVRFADLGGIAVNSMGGIYVADVGPGPDLGSTVRQGVPADAAGNPGRLVNLSTLAFLAANQKFTVGFVTGGAGTTGNQPLLVRAMGPTLVGFGVQFPLPAPAFEMFNYASNVIAADLTGWGSNADAVTRADSLTGAFPPAGPNSLDAAMVADFGAGGYTAQVWGLGNLNGQALAEIYDANPSYTVSSPRLINGSSLDNLAAGRTLTLGFFIGGAISETVLIRASGPALAAFNLAGLMADPQIKLFSGQNLIASNAGWNGDPQVAHAAGLAGAFSFLDTASRDSAIVETLPPGGYTVQVGSLSGGGGTVLVEVYEVP
jgi:hypothetical protein